MSKFVLGIDPGSAGGWARVSEDTLQPPTAGKLDLDDSFNLLQDIRAAAAGVSVIFVEKVQPSPPQRGGERRSGTKSMFSFGRGVGMLEMLLTVIAAESGIRFEYVTPRQWQQHFQLYGKGEASTTEKKNRHKAVATRLFPSIKVTHAVADALLIAEYGIRSREQAEYGIRSRQQTVKE